jgi:hypothetical protein
MRVAGTTAFPHAMAFGAAGDPALSRFEGQVTAREARALGVHWVYYPVADVNINPDNPVLNIRSFGEDPRAVAAQVAAFIEGAHSDPRNYVLTTAKHFPGHGDTSVDSHLNLATLGASRERMESVELVPFRAAIAARHRRRDDGTHRRARARAGGFARHAFARHPHWLVARRAGIQGPGDHRCARNGWHRQGVSARRRGGARHPGRRRCLVDAVRSGGRHPRRGGSRRGRTHPAPAHRRKRREDSGGEGKGRVWIANVWSISRPWATSSTRRRPTKRRSKWPNAPSRWCAIKDDLLPLAAPASACFRGAGGEPRFERGARVFAGSARAPAAPDGDSRCSTPRISRADVDAALGPPDVRARRSWWRRSLR